MSSSDKKDALPTDQKLDDLLDDALGDFQKVENKTEKSGSDGLALTATDTENADFLNDDFFINQAKLLGERMNSVFATEGDGNAPPSLSNEQLAMGFQKMAEAAAMALEGQTSNLDDGQKFASSISEALKGLQEGVENVEAPVSETDIANMFSSLQLGGEGDDGNNPFLPFMEGMMQSLLSSEILLPSIKELSEKYPLYLEENAEKLSAEDKERYEKQNELFEIIRKQLEAEKPEDTAEQKQIRFKSVLENMQKLHEYGQPPEELVGDQGGVGMPGLGMPPSLDNAQGPQCPMM